MSVLAQLGGTEMVPTALRVSAMGLASYGALTWISKHYGVDILQAAPHRILAAGVIAVASEFALRQFSSSKGMHVARLKASARALQKDLQDPKNREMTRGVLNEAGFNIDKEGMDALANGQMVSNTQETLAHLQNEVGGIKDILIDITARGAGPIRKRRQPRKTDTETVIDVTPEKEDAKEESKIIKEQREEIQTLTERLEALEAMMMEDKKRNSAG